MVTLTKEEQARARKLREQCVDRASAKFKAALDSPANKNYAPTPTETSIFQSLYRSIYMGYTVSTVAGIVIARGLALRAQRLNKRPYGFFSQLLLTAGITALGGAAHSFSVTPPAVRAFIHTEGEIGNNVCSFVKEMEPCLKDPACMQVMKGGGGKYILTWYEECLQRAAHQRRTSPVDVPAEDASKQGEFGFGDDGSTPWDTETGFPSDDTIEQDGGAFKED